MAVSGSDEHHEVEGTGFYLLEFYFGGKSLVINNVISYILFNFPIILCFSNINRSFYYL